jgi:hypothetical protein
MLPQARIAFAYVPRIQKSNAPYIFKKEIIHVSRTIEPMR